MIMYFVTDFNPKDADLLHTAGVEDVLVSFWILQTATVGAKINTFYKQLHGINPPKLVYSETGEVVTDES